MDIEKLMQSMKPVSEVFTKEHVDEKVAAETDLQKKFDNRVGPSAEGNPPIEYHVFSPVKGDESAKYPVVIWLHGMGQGYCFREPLRGTDIANFVSEPYQAKFGKGAYIMIPRANEDLGKVDTIARFMYSNSWVAGSDEKGVPDQLPSLLGAIRQFLAEEKEHIDTSRIYLSGFSAGGHMTWQVLHAMPTTFAAVAPICHARHVPTPEQIKAISHVPLWIICGEKDELYKPFVEPTMGLLANHKSDYRATIFETVENPDRTPVAHQHFSWVPVTYDMFYNDGKPYDEKYPEGFIAWLMSHSL